MTYACPVCEFAVDTYHKISNHVKKRSVLHFRFAMTHTGSRSAHGLLVTIRL
jgi:hypothetical protein